VHQHRGILSDGIIVGRFLVLSIYFPAAAAILSERWVHVWTITGGWINNDVADI